MKKKLLLIAALMASLTCSATQAAQLGLEQQETGPVNAICVGHTCTIDV